MLRSAVDADCAAALINSSTFFLYFILLGDGFHCGKEFVHSFPASLDDLSANARESLLEQKRLLMDDMKEHAVRRVAQSKKTRRVEYDEFWPRKKMDMAFFKRTPTTTENCVMVLDAKGLGQPLNDRVAQPQRYVERSGLKSVRYVLTTDGPSVFLYEKDADGWAEEPTGHLDVTTLQRSYLLPEGTNPVETLVRLQPSAV